MLHLHTADRLAPLAARLADVLVEAPRDPFTPEWIATPSVGLRRWLALDLARRLGASRPGGGDGVAANIVHAFPGQLRAAVLSAGQDADDPWAVDRLSWAVLAVLDETSAPELAAIQAVGPGGSRFGRARRIADLFDRYQVHRPAMVRAWADGRDVDALDRALPGHHRWQPILWRAVRARVGSGSPAERLPEQLTRLAAGEIRLDLPERLCLFGLSVLPGGAEFVDLAVAVGARHDLHVLLLDVAPAATERVLAERAPADGRPRLRIDDRSAQAVGHPLLRSWGRLTRETAILVADAQARGGPEPSPVGADEPASDRGPDTLLARLQAEIRSGVRPRADLDVADDDRSIQVHATHGPARQVEVLRDVLLGLLADDPTLTEDDIVVLCPALDRMAPLIEASFGPSADRPVAPSPGRPPALRYELSDRSLRSSNPVLAATSALLDLVAGRLDATAMLDLLSLPAVREAHDLTDDDLDQIAEWVEETHVRWGLDPEHRTRFAVPAELITNTWQAALDRLLLGSAVADDVACLALGAVVPLGVRSDDVELVGRLADIVGRIATLVAAAETDRPLDEWLALLRAATEGLVGAPRGQEWQTDALRQILADVESAAADPSGQPPTVLLSWADVRRLLVSALEVGRSRPGFFRGGITFTSPTALRGIPHRVVVLLGLDHGSLAGGAVEGDDLVAASAVIGDRDPRADDRQALLEAVLAAGDHLVVVRDGHDVRTNQAVPPSVVVAELCEAALATASPATRPALEARLEITHPRQRFDERCVAVGALRPAAPFTFDPQALAGALARRERTVELSTLASTRLAPPAAESPVVDLADLHDVLANAVRHFLRRRLELQLPRAEEARPTELPVELAMLAQWKVGARLLTTMLDGGDPDAWLRVERHLGTLPAGVLGRAKEQELITNVSTLLDAARERGVRRGRAEVLPIDATLPGGVRVVGSVAGRLEGEARGPARLGFGSLKPSHRLAAWLDLLALVATDPTESWRSVVVHRARRGKTSVADPIDLRPLPDDPLGAAQRGLAVVVDLARRAACEPLPLLPTVSPAVAVGSVRADTWRGHMFGGDAVDAHIGAVWGHLDLHGVLELAAQPDDPPGDGGRVARYAHLLWDTVAETAIDLDAEDEA